MTKTQPEPAYYILITSNLRTFERMIPADEIIRKLLDSGYWLLGSRTRNRKRIKAGDKAIFYASGLGNSVFLAAATITGAAEPVSRQVKRELPEEIINELNFEYPELYSLELADSFFFAVTVPAKPLIERLSFIKNLERWGSYFQGGSIGIPKEDFELILNEGRDKQVVR